MRRVRLGPTSLVAVSSVLGACSSGAARTTPAPASCAPYRSSADLSAPVSFSADVVPIFARHCAVGGGTCHGDMPTLPYLGVPDGSVDPAGIVTKIVGVPSGEDPRMNFVSPGDPTHSFLMHKIDGDACTLASDCATNAYGPDLAQCGATMPFLAPMLPPATRDVVRAWIAQGAVDD